MTAKTKLVVEDWVSSVIASLHGMMYGAHLMIHLKDYSGSGALCGAAQADAMMALALMRDKKSDEYKLIESVKDELSRMDSYTIETFPQKEHDCIVSLEQRLAAYRGRPLKWFNCEKGVMLQ
jgi:hypothetical protein